MPWQRRIKDLIMILTPGGTFVVQGGEVTDPEALAQMEIPDYETVVEVPKPAITACWRNRVELISSAKRHQLFRASRRTHSIGS